MFEVCWIVNGVYRLVLKKDKGVVGNEGGRAIDRYRIEVWPGRWCVVGV